jgi:hypothetical protein
MSLLSLAASRSVLLAASGYFLVCGVSAILFPQSWLWAAGLSTTVTTELHLAFGVIGAYLCAFAFGAYVASGHPANHTGLISTLVAGNVLDFVVTLRAITQEQLPIVQGSIFVVVTIVWSTLLVLALLSARKTGDAQ